MKFTFFNNRAEATSIAEIRAYDGDARPVKPISHLFKRAELFHQTANVSEPAILPQRLESGQGLVGWVLVEYPLPAVLGEIVFALHGDDEGLSNFEKQIENV